MHSPLRHKGNGQALHFERNIPTRPPKTHESVQTSTAQQVFAQFQQIILILSCTLTSILVAVPYDIFVCLGSEKALFEHMSTNYT